MLANWPACYKRVRIHEGGNDDDPRDPGGRTSRGIIQREYDSYRRRKGLPTRDVWQASEAEITEIYKTEYWDALRCDALPSGLDDSVDDYGINSGIGRAGKVLRRVLGLPDNDWHVTDQVLAAITLRDVAALINAFNDERMRFLRSLRTFPTFGNGWTRRVSEVRAFSLSLASGKAPAQPQQPANGKGHVATPPNTKPITTGGTAGAGALATLSHFVIGHPELTAALAVTGIGVTIFVVNRLEARHKSQQEAPTPGLVPVLAKAA